MSLRLRVEDLTLIEQSVSTVAFGQPGGIGEDMVLIMEQDQWAAMGRPTSIVISIEAAGGVDRAD